LKNERKQNKKREELRIKQTFVEREKRKREKRER